ncbi:MAG: anthranilate synthase component I family protein [Candidatus Omnitrophica bacterium]|nr:anthranilate synthase component I family protein [Candidatus Omnitrophota bacterium]
MFPSFAEFKAYASRGIRAPLFRQVPFWKDPFRVYASLRKRGSPSVLLESARQSEKTGRYSFVAVHPFLVLTAKGSKVRWRAGEGAGRLSVEDPFDAVRSILKRHRAPRLPGYPPFVGGAVGYVGYEAKNLIEPQLVQRAADDLGLPDIYFAFFDKGIVFDHASGKVFAFVCVDADGGVRKSYDRAKTELELLERALSKTKDRVPRLDSAERNGKQALRVDFSVSRAGFMKKVKETKRFIRRGDIFQANLSQRFSFPFDQDGLEVYRRLKDVNPSPFFGFLDAGDFQIVCGSPERLVRLESGVVETRPLAGTRSRGRNDKEDKALSLELLLNEKERAEHIMLVDLERNDLGRVCEYGSVRVDELMTVENYSHVKHIVSNVRGALKGNLDGMDVLKALFPGGTITGAPKVRCMEIIDELEPVARGPYTGSLGYFSFTGDMDFNIIIRSLVVKGGRAYLHAGAGIVADSLPEREYAETLYKAEAVFSAAFGKDAAGSFLARQGAAG